MLVVLPCALSQRIYATFFQIQRMMASIGPRNYMWFPSVRNFNSHSIIAGKLLVIIGDYYGSLNFMELNGDDIHRLENVLTLSSAM